MLKASKVAFSVCRGVGSVLDTLAHLIRSTDSTVGVQSFIAWAALICWVAFNLSLSSRNPRSRPLIDPASLPFHSLSDAGPGVGPFAPDRSVVHSLEDLAVKIRRNALLVGSALAAGLFCSGTSALGQVKISEVWGGGGNSASAPNADYVEIFNAGNGSVNINGWSVQVTQGSGFTWNVLPLSGTMAPRSYYLVRINNPSATGTALPTPNVAGTFSGGLLSTGSGKVALMSTTTALTGNPSCPFSGSMIDFLGYGASASNREPCGGTAANNAPSNTLTPDIFSTHRLSFGCFDTDVNVNDFVQLAPDPQNSSTVISSFNEISGSLSPASVLGGSGALVNVQAFVRACATPILGATVTADLSQFGLGTLTLLDDGGNDDGIANNGRYGANFNVPVNQGEGDAIFNVSYTSGPNNGSSSVTLNIQPFPPANDECVNAEDLSNALPYFATVSNFSAQPDIDVGTCNSDASVTRFGFWYRFDAISSGILRFTETSTQDVVYGFFNPFNAFDPCNNLNTPICSTADTSTFAVTAGQTYLILIGNQTATAATAGPTEPIQLAVEFIPPPSNNDCGSAVGIFVPPTFFETIDATSATSDIDVSCNSAALFDTTAGVWYSFSTGPEDGVVVVTETSTANTVSALFQGDCNSLFETSCQAAETGVHVVAANSNYFLLVATETGTQPTVPYAFSVDFFTSPVNDLCTNAILIDLNNEFTGTASGISAGPDIDVQCNSGVAFESAAGVWYRFTTGPEAGRLRINETSTADTVKGLFSGTDCNGLSEVACADAEDNTFNLDANTSYFLLLAAFGTANPTAEYAFTITFSPAVGACCMGTSCTVSTQTDCGTAGGVYQGPNVSCNGGPQYADATEFTILDSPNNTVSTISVADTGTLSTIEVYVDLFHSFAGDLIIRLIAPDASTNATLITRPGRASDCDTIGSPFGSGNNLDGEYLWSDVATLESHAVITAGPSPIAPFNVTNEPWRANGCGGTTVDLNATFANVPINGTWTLQIEDRAGGDTGMLRGWRMAINGGSNPPCDGGGTPCPGDYNDDGMVDLLDLLAFNGEWSGNLGTMVPMGTLGDYDNSGTVDLLDLLAFNGDWSSNLGTPCP